MATTMQESRRLISDLKKSLQTVLKLAEVQHPVVDAFTNTVHVFEGYREFKETNYTKPPLNATQEFKEAAAGSYAQLKEECKTLKIPDHTADIAKPDIIVVFDSAVSKALANFEDLYAEEIEEIKPLLPLPNKNGLS